VTGPALKEWSAVVHALLAGRQAVLLRKGGVHEKRFSLDALEGDTTGFLAVPTVAHSHAGSTRPEHHDLLAAGAADVDDDRLVVRARLQVTAVVPVARPGAVDALLPWHIWTADSVRRNRVDFRPRHRLTVLVVRAQPLVDPLVVPRRPEYGGCRSWVQLLEQDTEARPEPGPAVLADDRLTAIAAEVRALVG
jgi:hypothetical protein